MIHIVGSSRYCLHKKEITQIVSDIMVHFQIPLERSLNIIFVGKRKMLEIATKYKKEKEALPVLSFVYDENRTEDKLLGEVFLCYPQVVLLAAERNKRVGEMIKQLLVHGIQNLIAD